MIIWSSNSTSGYIPKRIESRVSNRCLYTHVHSSIIHNSQKVDATSVHHGWMDKHDMVYTYNGILLSLKKEGILTNAATWMILEDIMLSERSQSQKDKYCVIPVTWGTSSSQTHRDRKENGGCQVPRERDMGSYCLMGAGFQFYKMKEFWRWMVVTVAQHHEGI